MEKIKSQSQIDKKKRRNQLLVGVVMIGLLVMATAGYSLMSSDGGGSESKVNEAGIDFFKQNGRWVAQIDGMVFGFINLPSEVSDVDVNISATLGQYSGETLYFVNPNEGTNEVLTNIGNYILRSQEACLGNETCVGDNPIKNCESNLIIFESGNSTEVHQEGNCVFIVGEALRGTDAFLYKVLQII